MRGNTEMTAVLPQTSTNGSSILDKDSIHFQLPDGRLVRLTAKYLTPEEAQQMLSLNIRNRPISNKAVDQIANDIAEGAWEFNGDTIKVIGTPDGPVLADAQHRLRGIVKSGIAVPVIIVENLDPDVTDTIDQGRPRNVGDILRLTYGRQDLKYESTLTAIAALLLHGYDGSKLHSRKEVAAFANDHFDKLSGWACWAKTISTESQRVPLPGRNAVTASLGAAPLGTLAIHMTDNGADYESVTDFFQRIATGTVSENDHSNIIQAIRKRQSNGLTLSRAIAGGSGSSYPLFMEFATYIIAYNRWVCGEQVSIIKGQKEFVREFSQLPQVSRLGR